MNKHSTTPWSLYADGYIYSSEYDAIPIVECDINDLDIDEREANKELIVKAVNFYIGMSPQILDAIKRYEMTLSNINGENNPVSINLRCLIRKVEEYK